MDSVNIEMPEGVGASFKPEHFPDILPGVLEGKQDRVWPDVDWFEVHPENYMGDGGRALALLERIREHYPLSLHSVGLSIGGADSIDEEHLKRLATVIERYQPAFVSEHLAWSTHQGQFFNDLLSLPYTEETLRLVCDHVDKIQEFLARRILLENPATYITFENNTYEETSFISTIAKQTGCGLLLDVNNVHVSCTNHGWQAGDYIDRFPLDRVEEIHLAGHAIDESNHGKRFLIDSHDRPVTDEVWNLYTRLLKRGGRIPTLIEWDNDIPRWRGLYKEAQQAARIMGQFKTSKRAFRSEIYNAEYGHEASNVA